MSEKNCRTPVELDDETTRLHEILTRAAGPDSKAFREAARKACDSTLARLVTRLSGGPLAEPWATEIQAILDLRSRERAAKP